MDVYVHSKSIHSAVMSWYLRGSHCIGYWGRNVVGFYEATALENLTGPVVVTQHNIKGTGIGHKLTQSKNKCTFAISTIEIDSKREN
jgi:hypothetical protein